MAVAADTTQILIDLSPNAGESLDYWKRWSHLPAVENERLVASFYRTATIPLTLWTGSDR